MKFCYVFSIHKLLKNVNFIIFICKPTTWDIKRDLLNKNRTDELLYISALIIVVMSGSTALIVVMSGSTALIVVMSGSTALIVVMSGV